VWKHSSTFAVACALAFGCQKADVPERHPQTEPETLERNYAAWASKVPRPSQQMVERIEALLAKEPCVGRLDRWSRSYAYNGRMSGGVYLNIVDFHLEEAGTFGIQPGRHITAPNSWVAIDDRPIRVVSGDYDLGENRLRIAFCGENAGPAKSEVDRMRAYWDDLDRRRAKQRPTRIR
jgi:hypothetical protein